MAIMDESRWSNVAYAGGDGGAGTPLAGLVETVTPNPREEYIAGGNGYSQGLGEVSLPDTIDDLTRAYGAEQSYEMMKSLPAVSASVKTVKLGIMAGEIKLVSTFPVKPGQKPEERDEDQINAEEMVKFGQRLMNSALGFRGDVLQLLEAVEGGNKLGEKIGKLVTDGEDSGRIMLKSINAKKRQAWQFIVDRGMNVTGIMARGPDNAKRRIDPSKFCWLTWMPANNDPRGTSILRAAYLSWNLAVKLLPQYYKYLCQFAVPSLVGEMAPNDTQERVIDGVKVSANRYFRLILEKFQNSSTMVVPHGAKVLPLQVAGDGSVFLSAFEFFAREIIFSILLQTRATKEAVHGSKADAQQGDDILGLVLGYGHETVGEMLRYHVFRYFIALNFGEAWADRYTPYVMLGAGDKGDLASLATAFAGLFRSGAITPSIIAETYAMFGLPVPDVAADQKAAQEQFEAAQRAASQAIKDDDGSGSDDEEE